MAEQFDWIEVRSHGIKPIGAIGFLGNDAVVVAAYHDDRDGNEDGTVSVGEYVISKLSPIGLDGRAVTKVAMAARVDVDIVTRDPSIGQLAGRMFVDFGGSMVLDGFYAAYFARGVKATAGGVASVITQSRIKQFVIRKGFEKAAKQAFDAAVVL